MGPLSGIRILELAAIGPVPFAGMLLADLGADVVRIDRPNPGPLGGWSETRYDIAARGRRSVILDLKDGRGREAALALAGCADILLEGLRPGVAEKLGLSPEICWGRNPRLVYGRMTGWGQEGPLAQAAGHDINYIALSGALAAIGTPEGSLPPLNLVGDYGGGALYLTFGVLAAFIAAQRSGHGQVVDAAMVDGATSLMSVFFGLEGLGLWNHRRGSNMLDGGAPFYGVYRTADDLQVSLGAIEPQFWATFLELTGLAGEDLPDQHDQARWPELRARLEALFRGRTRAEWCALLEGTDACFAPVLTMAEAAEHPHLRERGTLRERDGVVAPAAAPRFSRTTGVETRPAPKPGADTKALLAEAGFDEEEIEELIAAGVAATA
jgi:alpha-methylacyl-CoA racemase